MSCWGGRRAGKRGGIDTGRSDGCTDPRCRTGKCGRLHIGNWGGDLLSCSDCLLLVVGDAHRAIIAADNGRVNMLIAQGANICPTGDLDLFSGLCYSGYL